MRAIWHMAVKDLRLLFRDGAGLFWMIAFPLIMALFFGFVFGGFDGDGSRAKMKVSVSDMTGGSQYAKEFTKLMDSSETFLVSHIPRDSARDLVRRGKLQAYVSLAPDTNESNQFFQMYPGGVPRIEVGIDPSRTAEAAYLRGAITQAHYTLIMEGMMNPSRLRELSGDFLSAIDTASDIPEDKRSALQSLFGGLKGFADRIPVDSGGEGGAGIGNISTENSPFQAPEIRVESVVRQRVGPRSSFDITFPQSLMWALIGCVTAFSLSIVTERTRGTLIRLRLAPVTQAHIIGGKALACFLACLGLCALLMSIGVFIFGVSMDEPLKLLVAILACAVCFVGVMMLISNLGKTERAVSGAGWAVMLIMSMTGGGMVPLMVMPDWMVSIGSVSPVRWGITALEGAIWRGYSYSELLFPVVVLVSVGIAGFGFGVWLLSRRAL